MHKGQQRILYLDGLRGLAILLTMIWHYLGPIYAMHLPYGHAYAHWPLVRYGWAGVNLFFLISGYVIFMTLERCSGFVDFIARRWLRLFPAMLLASLIIFAAAQPMAGEMPGGQAMPIDFLPGLTFTNPFYFRHWWGIEPRSLDGAFWSLYVEVAFYVAIGLMFFRIGWARSVAGLVALYALSLALPELVDRWHLHLLDTPRELIDHSGLQNFGWFASGALFLKARVHQERGLFWMAVALGFCSALTTLLPGGLEHKARYALFAAIALFALIERVSALQWLLETRPMQFLGRISYPFYLLHSAIGIGLIAVIARAGLPPLVAPVSALAAMIALAWIVATWFEPLAIRALRPLTDIIRRGFRARPSSVVPQAPGAPA